MVNNMSDFNQADSIDKIGETDKANEICPPSLAPPELKRSEAVISPTSYSREVAFSPDEKEMVTDWTPIDETTIAEMFGDLASFRDGEGGVEWDKVDYDIYGEDWYREKFPNFPEEWYSLIVKASREKYKDLMKKDDKGFQREEGNFTISFNK